MSDVPPKPRSANRRPGAKQAPGAAQAPVGADARRLKPQPTRSLLTSAPTSQVTNPPDQRPALQQLCPNCALCCNGALFRDVELQPADDPARLAALGLPVKTLRHLQRFPQPCVALDGCRCRIYAERPTYCRQFDCALLKSVQAGQVSVEHALRHIRKARRLLARALALLRELGDTDETRPLRQRCLRTLRRHESAASQPAATALADLTLAWHDLNRELAAFFHPGTM